MTPRYLHQNAAMAVVMVVALSAFSMPVFAAEEGAKKEDSGTLHPVDETKKAAKAVGHGAKKATKAVGHAFRDGARAVGHGAKKVTRDVGHAFRDGAHELTDKKD